MFGRSAISVWRPESITDCTCSCPTPLPTHLIHTPITGLVYTLKQAHIHSYRKGCHGDPETFSVKATGSCSFRCWLFAMDSGKSLTHLQTDFKAIFIEHSLAVLFWQCLCSNRNIKKSYGFFMLICAGRLTLFLCATEQLIRKYWCFTFFAHQTILKE